MTKTENEPKLPGEDLVRKGADDFAAGRRSLESYLVQIGSGRLRSAGVKLEGAVDPDADHKLYELLSQTHGDAAHAEYNTYLRQLVSFERALENLLWAREQTVDQGAGV